MRRGLFLRKHIHGAASDKEEGAHQLKRHLSSVHLTAIGIGAIIGAGIFVVTGQAAANYAGPGIVLSFMIAALICVFAGLCYAELASIIPLAGGSYSYTYVAMGEFPAWIIGWSVVIQYLASACAVAVGWSGYFVSILGDFGIHLPSNLASVPLTHSAETGWQATGSLINLPAVILVFLITTLISVGIRAVAKFNNLMVFIKLSTILLFVVFGIQYIQVANWHPFIPENTGVFGEFGWSGILRGAGLVFFAYNGFDTVSTLSQEAINPQKDVPRGILGSLGISTIAYVATVLVLTGIANYTLLGVSDPMSVALNAMGAKFLWLSFTVKFAILVALASVVLAQLLGQTRIFFAMSKDGLLPKRLSKVHHRFGTPLFNTALTGVICALIAGFFPINILGYLVSLAVLLVFGIVCLGVLILRFTHPEYHRPFKVPFVPYVPLAGLLACLAQMFFLPLTTWIQLLCWLVIGLLIYFTYSIRHSKIRKAAKR
ncbi:MAG TPA: amino acid permease [Rhabdochlamydiaceae bacterium]|nr:amino acid permease [Rhabdochlamydiaceae bacterium]